MSYLHTLRELNFNAKNLAEEWRRWEKSFKIYYAAAELGSKTVTTQVAILLNCAGESARDIFDSFGVALDSEDTTCVVVLAKFRDYCNPRRKLAFESPPFWQRQQAESETFDKWLTELKITASNCEFVTSTNWQLRDKILLGTNDDAARQRTLEEDNLTLAKAINICHSMETTKAQLRVMTTRSETDTVTVHELHSEGRSNCGSKHQPRQCPAYGKTCYKCGKLNHFAALCRSTLITRPNAKQANEVTTGTTSQSDPSVLRVQSLCRRKKRNFVGSKIQSTLPVNGTHTCTFKVGTGAEANIRHQSTAASTWWCGPRPRLGWVEMAVGLPEGPSYPVHSPSFFAMLPLIDRSRAAHSLFKIGRLFFLFSCSSLALLRHLLLLFLMSGNVHPNPGPIFPYSVCAGNVTWRGKSVLCCTCSK